MKGRKQIVFVVVFLMIFNLIPFTFATNVESFTLDDTVNTSVAETTVEEETTSEETTPEDTIPEGTTTEETIEETSSEGIQSTKGDEEVRESEVNLVTTEEGTRVQIPTPQLRALVYPSELDIEMTVGDTTIKNIDSLKEEVQTYLSEALFISKDAIHMIEGSKNAVDTQSNFDWWIYDRYNNNPTYDYIEDYTVSPHNNLTGTRTTENSFNAGTGDDALNATNSEATKYSYYNDQQIDDTKHQYIEMYTEGSIYPIYHTESNKIGLKGVANWILSRHIKTHEDGSITMYGYGSPAYNDWMYLSNDSPSSKVFAYDTHGEIHDALDGTGFLFNTQIDDTGYASGEQKINGYLFWVDDQTTTAKLFKLINVDAKWLHTEEFVFDGITSYNESGNQIELVASTSLVSNVGNWNRYKIEANETSLRVWFNSSANQEELKDNLDESDLLNWTIVGDTSQVTKVTLEPSLNYGFGPFASYQSHGCSRRTSFTYENLQMFIEVPRKLDYAIDNQYWNNATPNIIINVSDTFDDKFNNDVEMSYMVSRLLNDQITYIGVGNDSNNIEYFDEPILSRGSLSLEEFTNEILRGNNQNGALIDKNATQLVGDISRAILSNIAREETQNEIMISLGEQIKFVEDIKLIDTSTTINENFPDGNWKFIHTTDGFLRSSEIEVHPTSDIPMMELAINFDRPGKYAIFYQDIPYKNVYVSERPEVNIQRNDNVQRSVVSSPVSYSATVKDIEAYDYNGGGYESNQEWSYFDVTSSEGAWVNGKVESVEDGDLYIVQVRGENELGIKSKPDSQILVGAGDINEIIVSNFNYNHSEILKVGQEENTVDLTEKSYDPAGDSIHNYFWTLTDPKGSETTLFDDVRSQESLSIDLSDYGAGQLPGYYLIGLKVYQALPVFDSHEDTRLALNEYSQIFTRAVKVEDYTDLEKATKDAETLSLNLNGNQDKEHIETNIKFDYSSIYDSTYKIESSNPQVISNTGVVTRPSFGQGAYHVTLSIYITQNKATVLKTLELDVIALPPTDEEAVNAEYDNVKVLYYGTEILSRVMKDVELVSEQSYDTQVQWQSDNTKIIDENGKVTSLAYGSPPVNVQLIATISRGEAVKTKKFDITVVAPTPPSSEEDDEKKEVEIENKPDVESFSKNKKEDIFEEIYYYKKEGKTIAKASINHEKLVGILQNINEKEQIDIATNQSGIDILMHLDDVKDLKEKSTILDIKTSSAEYFLDTKEIAIEELQESIGKNIPLEEIEFEVVISEPENEEIEVIENEGEIGNYSIKVPPISFEITAHHGEETETVERFNVFMKRQITIPPGVDPNAITTAITVDKNDKIIHVPTKIEEIDGSYYATFNSLTNSSYTLVEHYQHYLDIDDSYAKDSIQNMGNRMVFLDTNYFGPKDYVTRLEAAMALSKALSIKASTTGDNNFVDIENEEYEPYIQSLNEYGIVLGIDEDHFNGNASIMRQELMLMLYRAHINFGLTSNNEYNIPYSDKLTVEYVHEIAEEAALWCQRNRLVMTDENGKRDNLEAQDPITRAQLAEAIDQFLQNSSLINQ